MSVSASERPALADRRARAAVAVLFLTNGALFSNLIPRLPGIKSDLGLDNAAYGLVVAAFPAGAISAGLASAFLIRRFGSAPMAVIGTVLTGLGVFAAVLVPSPLALAALLFFAGAADSVTDVAQNAHGLRVQRRYGRSIINSFHALWSIGAVLGGSMAAAALAVDLPRPAHLGTTAVLFSLTAVAAYRFRLPGPDEDPAVASAADGRRGSGVGVKTVLVLAALIGIAMGGTLVEDAGSSWATLYLSTELTAPAAFAASGYIALVGAQFIGRMIGDRLVDRFGQRAVARAGGLLAAVGMSAALAFPTVPGTVLGFAAAGFGVATLVPAAMHEADELPGLRAGTGLTVVSWLMRLSFLLSPPLIGLLADATSLRTGLVIVPVAGVMVASLAGVLASRLPARPADEEAPAPV